MKKIKVGIVGLGNMGQLYADALMRNPSVVMSAVSDKKTERLEFAKKNYKCKTFENYKEMYKTAGLNAVIITLPDFMHKDPVIKAAEAGLHILVEKPFATSVADAKDMIEAVKKAGVKCTVEFFNRWSPPFTEAKKSVERGDLGEIVAVSAELNDAIIAPTEMLKWLAKSSPAWFLMSHMADIASWITGKRPATVHAQGVKKILVKRGIDTYDLIEALVEYPDGTLGRFTNCWVLPNGMPIVYEIKMRLVGSKAAIDINTSDQEIHLITQERLNHPITDWGNILGRHVGHPYTMLSAFIDNIIENTEPEVTLKDALENIIFLESVHKSLETGKKINIKWE
jgi:predicted dehydrogenase